MLRIQTEVILENKSAYKVTRNNKDLVHRHTTFIIAPTCLGYTKQTSSGCMYEKMLKENQATLSTSSLLHPLQAQRRRQALIYKVKIGLSTNVFVGIVVWRFVLLSAILQLD